MTDKFLKLFCKMAVVVVIFSAVISWATFNASAKPDNPSVLKEFIKDYLSETMNITTTRNVDELDKYYSNVNENSKKYLLFTKKHIIQDYLLAYLNNDYEIKKVYPKVKILQTEIKKDYASIEAILTTHIHWNAANSYGDPIIGTTIVKHLIDLHFEDKQWKIISDKYNINGSTSEECLSENYDNLINTLKNLKKETQTALSRSKTSPPAKLQIMPHPKERQKNTETAYDRDSAYNWAHNYWKNYSKEYINLGDQEWKGGDCTNFISQCLRAGGAQNDTKGTYQWYYLGKGTANTSNHSYSWTWATARGLNSTLLGNNRLKEFGPKGTEMVITGDSKYSGDIGQFVTHGDVIQYEWSANSNIKHSAIIVEMVYNSGTSKYEPVVATHTFDSWYLPWTKDAYKTHFIHITGVN